MLVALGIIVAAQANATEHTAASHHNVVIGYHVNWEYETVLDTFWIRRAICSARSSSFWFLRCRRGRKKLMCAKKEHQLFRIRLRKVSKYVFT
jgi:hypothetical protein